MMLKLGLSAIPLTAEPWYVATAPEGVLLARYVRKTALIMRYMLPIIWRRWIMKNARSVAYAWIGAQPKPLRT